MKDNLEEFKKVVQISELLPKTIKQLVRLINTLPVKEQEDLLARLNEEHNKKEEKDFFEETGLNLENEENRIAEIVSLDRRKNYERKISY